MRARTPDALSANRTLSGIVHSIASDLVACAAEVHLKERRRLVLVIRETPPHQSYPRAIDLLRLPGSVPALPWTGMKQPTE